MSTAAPSSESSASNSSTAPTLQASRPDTVIGVIGLGYVGLPLALAFGRQFVTIGFDIAADKVAQLAQGRDPAGEMPASAFATSRHLTFTDDPVQLGQCDYLIVAVPTPITSAKLPDLGPLEQVSQLIGKYMRAGATVIYESTVYPGVTEEICQPILQQWGKPFRLGYSPERISPGEGSRPLESIIKIVSGQDAATLADVSALYRSIITAGVHEAESIKVAEAAKILENTQRDVNIALMNEFALICQQLQINTRSVLAAAGTKWNFLTFYPGLVGGHCIGVDPYYLTFRAEQLGMHADLMMAARQIDDGMGIYIAQQCIKRLCQNRVNMQQAHVLILGLTFKENCADTRNTRVIDIVRELQSYGVRVTVIDPVAQADAVQHSYQLSLASLDTLQDLPPIQAVIAAVAHQAFAGLSLDQLARHCSSPAVFMDVKGQFHPADLQKSGFQPWQL